MILQANLKNIPHKNDYFHAFLEVSGMLRGASFDLRKVLVNTRYHSDKGNFEENNGLWTLTEKGKNNFRKRKIDRDRVNQYKEIMLGNFPPQGWKKVDEKAEAAIRSVESNYLYENKIKSYCDFSGKATKPLIGYYKSLAAKKPITRGLNYEDVHFVLSMIQEDYSIEVFENSLNSITEYAEKQNRPGLKKIVAQFEIDILVSKEHQEIFNEINILTFEEAVKKSRNPRKKYNVKRSKKALEYMDHDSRNRYIVIASLIRANGSCECCGKEAPFLNKKSQPYLEVHHIVFLCLGGKDTVENTAALCPNCHTEAHRGKNHLRVKKDLLKLRASDTY